MRFGCKWVFNVKLFPVDEVGNEDEVLIALKEDEVVDGINLEVIREVGIDEL